MVSADQCLINTNCAAIRDAAARLPHAKRVSPHSGFFGPYSHAIPKVSVFHRKGEYYKMSYPVNYNLSGDKMSFSDIVFPMTEAPKTIADRLKMARIRSELTQKDLAERIGKDITAYGHYERGRNEMNRETAIKLCEILNIDLDWLMTGRGSMDRASALPDDLFYDINALYEKQPELFRHMVEALKKVKE